MHTAHPTEVPLRLQLSRGFSDHFPSSKDHTRRFSLSSSSTWKNPRTSKPDCMILDRQSRIKGTANSLTLAPKKTKLVQFIGDSGKVHPLKYNVAASSLTTYCGARVQCCVTISRMSATLSNEHSIQPRIIEYRAIFIYLIRLPPLRLSIQCRPEPWDEHHI